MPSKRPMKRTEPIQGAGDVVKKVTEFLGIPTCDDCEKRRQALNRAFPFTRYVKYQFTEEEVEFILSKELSDSIAGIRPLQSNEIDKVLVLYNKAFEARQERCNCPTLMKSLIEKIIRQAEYQQIK